MQNSVRQGAPEPWGDSPIPKPVQKGFDWVAEHVPGIIQVWGSMAEMTAATVVGGKFGALLAAGSTKVGLATIAGGYLGFGVGMVPVLILMSRNGIGNGGSSGPHG